MKRALCVEVRARESPWPLVVLKVVMAVPVLALSIVLYLAGVLLVFTIVGAVLGIPLMLMTYALDALVLVMVLNARKAAQRIKCPACGRKKTIIPSVIDGFTCKGCKAEVRVRVTGG